MFKAILSMCTQILGMIVVLYQEVQTESQRKSHWCTADDHLSFKLMSFLFCILIFVFSYESFIKFETNGMYRIHHLDFHNKPDFINPFWVWIGRYINSIVLLMVLYGSFFLVYFSKVATDIVLNSVAMFFMLELDNLMVSQKDYKDLREFLDGYKHEKDYKISKFWLWFNRIVHFPFASLIVLSLSLAVPVSVVIGYCH